MTHLDMAGRTTLIKATLNVIPNHIMQIIPLPTNLISRLKSYQKNFLWGSTPQKRRLHLINWHVITTNKDQGGLGIQRLKDKNDALLAATAWRLFHNPHSHWVFFPP